MFRRTSNLRRGMIILFPSLAFLLVIFLVFEHNLKPTIREIAEAKARWVATDAVNEAIKQKVSETVDYHDLIFVHKDVQGRIVLMQPNIVRINHLAADITLTIQNTLEELADDQFFIPVGQVLGSQLLANYGPRIKVSIYPVGTVRTKIFDRFEEAGINQTRHRLYLDIRSRVKVVIPLITSNVKVATQIPITDTIIVGQVPETYVKFYAEGLKH